MRKIYITGTDTDVGKTYLSCKILDFYNQQGLKTIGLKPIATGINERNHQNTDALQLQKAASISLAYDQVNPYCFKTPTAPTIASAEEARSIDIQEIVNHIDRLRNELEHDLMIIEGVGGVFVPLNKTQTQLDLIKQLDCPVILVVDIKLGCINHTLLSIQCLKTHKIPILGWIANVKDHKMLNLIETIKTLDDWLHDTPRLTSFF